MKAHVPFSTDLRVSNPTPTQEANPKNSQPQQDHSRREPVLSGRSLSSIKEAARSFLSRLSLPSINMEFPGQSIIRGFVQRVSSVFPGISFEFLQSLGQVFGHDTEAAINHIMDEEELGRPYQRSEMKEPTSLKRKRDESPPPPESGALVAGMREQDNDVHRFVSISSRERLALCKLLHQEYPCVPQKELLKLLQDHNYCLRSTYLALDTFVRTWHSLPEKPWEMTSDPNTMQKPYLKPRNQRAMKAAIKGAKDAFKKSVLEELAVCWKMRAERDGERCVRRGSSSKDDSAEHIEDVIGGDLTECQCCFLEYRMRDMVHCEGEVVHFFCTDCTRRNAETLIGLSKYELTCMSMDKCTGGFSQVEREKFLDDKLTKALDRIESAAVLLLANLDGLVRCPFCNYAAEYPPVEEDKEFRCENPECKIVSCRLCQGETHIPKTCAELARENGHSARREIEEAMSAAMIRRCNRCNTPFVKENGCNKMTCTQAACRNVQCYVCSKTCDYRHFNDPGRGGKEGNCPLYDSVEVRHENEVKAAEEAARKAVVEKRPDVDPSLLNFDMSKDVLQDDERRKRRDPHFRVNDPIPAALFPQGIQLNVPPLPMMYREAQPQPGAQGAGMHPFLPAHQPGAQAAPPAHLYYPRYVIPAAEPLGELAIRPGMVPLPDPNAVGPIGPAAARLVPVDIDLLPLARYAEKFDRVVDQKINIHHPPVGKGRPGDKVPALGEQFRNAQRARHICQIQAGAQVGTQAMKLGGGRDIGSRGLHVGKQARPSTPEALVQPP